MPKRKRQEGQETDAAATVRAHFAAQEKRVTAKLYHGKKILHKAIKIAKAFERQKLGRRHKAAAQKGDQAELKRIEDELESLKTSDLSVLTEAYLYRSLLKSKEVKNSSLLPAQVTQFEKPSFETATANVNARLCNSKPVKDALSTAVTSIATAMGVQVRKPRTAAPLASQSDSFSAFRSRETDSRDKSGILIGGSKEELNGERQNPLTDNDAQSSDEEGINDSELEDEDRALSKYNARIAEVSDENDSDESDAEEPLTQADKAASNMAEQLSLSPAESIEPMPPEDAPASPPRKESKALFVPSLTLGGYISGSDSQPSDGEERATAADLRPKNRRGQRARQQIWEKKYGASAKHLQQPPGKTNGQGAGNRDAGWDAKRGATSGHGRPDWQKSKGMRSQNGRGTEIEARKPTQRQAEADAAEKKPLHPSWEAAKKAKQEKGGGAANFKGKKVVFD